MNYSYKKNRMYLNILVLAFYICLFSLSSIIASNLGIYDKMKIKSSDQKIRPEHFALNVPNPVDMANWYADNLGMKIMRKGMSPTFTCFVADSGKHMMLEFFHNPDFPMPDLKNIDQLSLHIAFMTDDVPAIKTKLLNAGATLLNDIKINAAGDEVVKLKDPWGLTIHFVKRGTALLKYVGVRVEHFGFNVPNAPNMAKWYVENLGMKVIRESGSPTFGRFISDKNENTTLELSQNDAPLLDYKNISHMSMHLAFESDDLQSIKEKLLSAGAKLVEDISKTPTGDQVLMLRDPWGQSIQFVRRAEPMLK